MLIYYLLKIRFPAPVPKAAKTRPDIKNLPSKSGREKLPINPPTIKRIKNTTAKTGTSSGISILILIIMI